MNILNEHFGKFALERKASCYGSLFKQFESALHSEKAILTWIAEHPVNLNDQFGKEQTTVLQRYSNPIRNMNLINKFHSERYKKIMSLQSKP